MHHRKILLLLINAVGATALLGSFAHALLTMPNPSALWAGLPGALQPVYAVTMWLAAAGYLIALAWLLLRPDPEHSMDNGTPLFERVNWLYGVILFCSALWLPITAAMLQAPDTALWLGLRAALLAVGIATVWLLLVLWQQRRRESGLFYTLALIGLVLLSLQTAVLNALVWPYYFTVL